MKFLNFKILIVTIAMAGGGVSSVKAQQQLTLNSAVDYALKNSAESRKAVLDEKAANHKIGEVRSSGLPQISANGEFQNYPNIPTQIIPGAVAGMPGEELPVQFGTEYNATGGFEASQILYSQSYITGLKAAQASRDLQALLTTGTQEDVAYEVADAFYNVLQLQSQKQVLDSNVKNMEALIEIVNSQYENDLVMKTELNRLKVNLSNLKTQVRGTDIAYERSLNYLKILMGMSMDTEIEVKEEKLDNLSMIALGSDSETPTDISILQKQKSLQALSVSNVKAGYVPQLSAFAQHSWQAMRNEFNLLDSDQSWFASTIVGLQLSVPIFDGFQKHHKIQQEKIALEKLEIDIRNTEQMLNMQEINAKRQLQNSFDAVAAQKENRDLADEVYEQTRQRYQQNIATMPDLIDAENAYISAQNNYINELIAFHKAELELLKAKGILLEKFKN